MFNFPGEFSFTRSAQYIVVMFNFPGEFSFTRSDQYLVVTLSRDEIYTNIEFEIQHSTLVSNVNMCTNSNIVR